MYQLNYRDSRPIYEQLEEQMRKHIVSGVIKTDDKLPSIREVSTSLAINPNTIRRAYRELESDGYIYTIPGKGSFVAPMKDIDSKKESTLFSKLDEIILELSYLGHTGEELSVHICDVLKKERKQ